MPLKHWCSGLLLPSSSMSGTAVDMTERRGPLDLLDAELEAARGRHWPRGKPPQPDLSVRHLAVRFLAGDNLKGTTGRHRTGVRSRRPAATPAFVETVGNVLGPGARPAASANLIRPQTKRCRTNLLPLDPAPEGRRAHARDPAGLSNAPDIGRPRLLCAVRARHDRTIQTRQYRNDRDRRLDVMNRRFSLRMLRSRRSHACCRAPSRAEESLRNHATGKSGSAPQPLCPAPRSRPHGVPGAMSRSVAPPCMINDQRRHRRAPMNQVHLLRRRLSTRQQNGRAGPSPCGERRSRNPAYSACSAPRLRTPRVVNYINQRKVPHLFLSVMALKWGNLKYTPGRCLLRRRLASRSQIYNKKYALQPELEGF